MGTYLIGVAAAVAITAVVVELLRRGILRERFAALWLAVCAVLVMLALFPAVLEHAAAALGFQVPANLLFLVSIVFLLLVCVQLSHEVSRVEARTRRLAEDLALLAVEVSALSGLHPPGVAPPPTPRPDLATGEEPR